MSPPTVNDTCPLPEQANKERQEALAMVNGMLAMPNELKKIDKTLEEWFSEHNSSFRNALNEIIQKNYNLKKTHLRLWGGKKRRTLRKGGNAELIKLFKEGSAKCHMMCVAVILGAAGISAAVLYASYSGALKALETQLASVSGATGLCDMSTATALLRDQLAKNALGSSCTEAVTEFAAKMAKIYTAMDKNQSWATNWTYRIIFGSPAAYIALYSSVNSIMECTNAAQTGGKRKNKTIKKNMKSRKSRR